MARDIKTPNIVTQKELKKSDLVHKIRTIGLLPVFFISMSVLVRDDQVRYTVATWNGNSRRNGDRGMAKDARPLQPQQTRQDVSYRPPYQHVASTGALRAVLIGAGIAVVLTGVECLAWIIVAHKLPAFGWLLLVAQVVIGALLALALNRPLALSRYAREVVRATERYRAVYTPLPDWLTLYTTSITCYQHSPDPTIPERTQALSLLDLVRPGNQFLVDPQEHLALLGATGGGKTTILYFFQFIALLRRRSVIFGRQKIPIYIPLRNYNLFLRTHAGWYAQEAALQPGITRLLDFLAASDMPGIHHVRPYLHKLADQGRLLLLYDGLHEIEEAYLLDVIAEVVELMSQARSRVIVACRQEDYLRQPELAQAMEANLVARAVIEPLAEEQARSLVEGYIESENSGKKWRHTAGQIMDMIATTRLRAIYSTPLMMLALLSVIDSIGIERGRRLDTRGRLMRAYAADLISQAQKRPAWQKRAPLEKDVLLFLGEIATAARWSNTPLAIQLHEHEHLLRIGLPSLEEHADALQGWLAEHVDDMFLSDNLHETYSRSEINELLAFALDAALIEISQHGFLSFRHEMLAAYAVAEYFVTLQAAYDTPMQPTSFAGLLAQAMKREDTSDAYTRWSLPLALWAGLLDDPLAQAQRFVEYGRGHPAATLDTLALGLLCMGVASAPPYVAHGLEVAMPPGFEETLREVLQDGPQRVVLARAITRHAEEDAQEIYQTLFLLLMLPDIDDLMILLDMEVVPSLLFNRLREIVDDSAYDAQVKRLARVIGHLGAVAVPQAAVLSRADAGGSPRLRSAAINILGGTGERSAVEALNACLYDQDTMIVGRAVNAMIRLGPELTLPSLVEELENLTSTSATARIHVVALRILEHFLKETNPERELTGEQRQLVMSVLSHVLQGGYAPEVQQKASEMLVQQGRAAEESAGGEMAVDVFVENLSSNDEQMASGAARALREIGTAATPALLKELRESPTPGVTARIVQTLGRVRDPRAMSALLRLLADPSPAVQHQVSKALQHFAPESIPGLIYQVLQGEDDLIATSAEQILVEIGNAAVEPVIEALIPVTPGRTHMLVHMLARVHDMEALPTLVALLETEAPAGQAPGQVDQQLVLALIDALGQFQDEQVVAPLIDMLASANPLFYEGAVNALSNLGDVACGPLLNALDVEHENVITSRIERALLGMAPFPGERLLAVYGWGSDAQAQHMTDIFVASGQEAAQLLVSRLVDPNKRLQGYVREAVGHMPGHVIVPALLEVIDHADPEWRGVVTEYLLQNPEEAIPPLVSLLDDPARGVAAQSLLLAFGLASLPALISGLDALSSIAHERSRSLVVELARQSPQGLTSVVQLFAHTPPPPQRARETLISLLARELVDISVPVLLDGLEDAHLVGDVSETLIDMVRQDNARSEFVLEALLDALRVPTRRHGAEITLVEIGARAVPGVGMLVTDDDLAIAQSAQNILCEMGTPAFSFIWAAHSDVNNPVRREAARTIFRRMPTVVIKDELVQLLSSDYPDDIAMALTLLLERIHDENAQNEREPEMIPVLLEHAQLHSDQRASLRILALLLLLGGRVVADSLEHVLYDFPNHSRMFLHAFLLLDESAQETLLEMLHDPDAPPLLRAEAAGVLGIISPLMDIREYAKMLAEYGMWAGRSQGYTDVLQVDQLNIALRALGGLLAGGHWNAAELQQLRLQSKESSPERELYDILLGWRYSPHIDSLEMEIERERQELKKHVSIFSAEILALRTANHDLEEELEGLHHEHGRRGRELEEATETAGKLSDSLERAAQDRQAMRIEIEQLIEERDHLAARNAYLEQVIRGLQE
jgi:HEAT repeat protein